MPDFTEVFVWEIRMRPRKSESSDFNTLELCLHQRYSDAHGQNRMVQDPK